MTALRSMVHLPSAKIKIIPQNPQKDKRGFSTPKDGFWLRVPEHATFWRGAERVRGGMA